MACFKARRAWISVNQRNPKTGKRYIRFRECQFVGGTEEIKVSCGSCEGCRIERSRQWAVRCWHEASLYENNVFITLTFAPKYLDSQGSLRKVDFQKFMKRLRKRFYGNTKSNVRYFHCGEYGDKFGRPHHHACLFNFTFPDMVRSRTTSAGYPVYQSQILSELWPYGIHEIGDVTLRSAGYVARYILKKVGGHASWNHYEQKEPEYVTMSRRPGIAHEWFKKYKSDVYPGDYVAMEGGFKSLPPKYYDKQFELTNPLEFANFKAARIERAKNDPHNTPERIAVRYEVLKRKLKLLKRGYEQ